MAGAETARDPRPDPGPVPAVTVILGGEELLVSRAVAAATAAARAVDPAAEVRDIAAGELTEVDVLDLQTPSLFDTPRVVVVRGVAELPEALAAELVRCAAQPTPGVALVAVHGGGVRGKRTVDALVAGGAAVVTVASPGRASQRWEFVAAEARGLGLAATAGGCRALVEAIGTDLRQLAMTLAQLASDGARTLDEPTVTRLRAGRAETRGFDVADAALSGDLPGSLALLESALDQGTPAVLVTSALASGLRELIRVRGAGAGAVPAVAKRLGLPPWKVERALRTARGWSDDGLASAVRVVARADAGVKGAAADPSWELTRSLLAMYRLRAGR